MVRPLRLLKSQVTQPSNCEIAWAAGLYEGEGWISVERHQYKDTVCYYTVLGIDMTDKDILDRFPEIFDYGSVKPKKKGKKDHYKEQFTWRVYKYSKILEVVELISPWLGKRRLLQIETALAKDTRILSYRCQS